MSMSKAGSKTSRLAISHGVCMKSVQKSLYLNLHLLIATFMHYANTANVPYGYRRWYTMQNHTHEADKDWQQAHDEDWLQAHDNVYPLSCVDACSKFNYYISATTALCYVNNRIHANAKPAEWKNSSNTHTKQLSLKKGLHPLENITDHIYHGDIVMV